MGLVFYFTLNGEMGIEGSGDLRTRWGEIFFVGDYFMGGVCQFVCVQEL